MEDFDFIVDASVLINMLALEDPLALCRALELHLGIPSRVASEVRRSPRDGSRSDELLRPFFDERHAGYILIDDHDGMLDRFVEVTSGNLGSSIDDGESACIAVAAESGTPLLLDDRKARSLCKENFPNVDLTYSVELFFQCHTERLISNDHLETWILDALIHGRMAVVEQQHFDRLTEILHEEQLRKCSSLRSFLG